MSTDINQFDVQEGHGSTSSVTKYVIAQTTQNILSFAIITHDNKSH